MEFTFNPGWIWFAVAALLLVAEMLTAGFFIFWFGVGAIVAGILALCGFGAIWQWLAFVVVSGVLVAYSRRFAERFTGKQPPHIGADRMVGKTGIVLEAIDAAKSEGRVRVESEEWRARSAAGAVIPAESKITVLRIDGTHLIVEIAREA